MHFITEEAPNEIKVRFSPNVPENKIIHSASEGVVYMSTESQYAFGFAAWGLEEGFEYCRMVALQRVMDKIERKPEPGPVHSERLIIHPVSDRDVAIAAALKFRNELRF